jgi:hypothetical protein
MGIHPYNNDYFREKRAEDEKNAREFFAKEAAAKKARLDEYEQALRDGDTAKAERIKLEITRDATIEAGHASQAKVTVHR